MATELTEKKLVQGLLAKDEVAVSQLVQQYGDRLLRTVYMLTKDYHQAEDVVQETFISALKSMKKFRQDSKLYTWLYTIAINKARMVMRKKQPILDEELLKYRPDGVTPEGKYLEGERTFELASVIKMLPYIYKEVIILHYYNQLSIEEISRITNTPTGTVKSRLQRGRQRMEQLMQGVKT